MFTQISNRAICAAKGTKGSLTSSPPALKSKRQQSRGRPEEDAPAPFWVRLACAHGIYRPLVEEPDTVTGTTVQTTGNSEVSERGGEGQVRVGGGRPRRKERGDKEGVPFPEGLLSS